MTKADPKRILIVEDSPVFASLLKRDLETKLGCVAEVEERGDLAVKRILDDDPDLVILDRVLPGLDGLMVCQQVRPDYSGVILMLSGLGDTHDQVKWSRRLHFKTGEDGLDSCKNQSATTTE